MELNDALVDKLARLSRLHFSEEEKKEIGHDLKQLIGFVNKLNELDLTGVPPTLHMGQEINNLRADVVKGSVSTEDALLNAPGKKENFFTVPKVIKKQE
ncbi:MAG: Asp-tRNA(Asn)/Glu-tRNA(Gln) amidotransferase subunit GatC [Chitinophagaceae bacterium]